MIRDNAIKWCGVIKRRSQLVNGTTDSVGHKTIGQGHIAGNKFERSQT